MAVHDLHETVIVSFLWNPFGDNKQATMPDIFFVDVWKRTGLAWKLAIRYASPDHDAAIKIPGFSMDEPVIEKNTDQN